jgi:hypothetical protein
MMMLARVSLEVKLEAPTPFFPQQCQSRQLSLRLRNNIILSDLGG